METSEINLRLDHYDDIFSDFDIRPYPKRALSVDFLEEIKRASRDKNLGEVELVLHVPETDGQGEIHQMAIKERLTEHFKKHSQILTQERKEVLKTGIGMVLLGVIFMVAATFIIFEDPSENWVLSFLVVFLEPAAWFLLWEGMDQIVFNSKNIKPDLDFYRKMSHKDAKIYFKTYKNS